MPLAINKFTPCLDAFIDRLGELSYYQFFVGAQLDRAKKSMERDLAHFEKKGWPTDAYFFGSGVPMMDILHSGEYVVRCPTKGRTTLGNDVFRMSIETERQFNAFMVVLLFEAMERYLRATYSPFLVEKGNTIPLRRAGSFHKSHQGWAARSGSPEYFEKYAAYACHRDCKDAVADFETHLQWARVVINGCFGMPFNEFIWALGICRHSIVHNHGRLSAERLGALSKPQQTFVNTWLFESLHGKEMLIMPDTKAVDDCFEYLASYGRGLYVLLSEFCGMEDETRYFKKTTS